ncbi:MAG: radical SAM protein [Candidatus Pacebacteria bacterium]|nr:radical SAM protein [Candidatus Paceibacterota bacterium]PIR63552.1 MAG: hypothetical protein COU64_03780 [Candidatus Pacebacteria bacterium CG10_big_fil_rev_8_21_14_0_10_40_26]PIZ79206.1 MAG: hypothetical protein COY01_02155 [Candidatus Pacebacteria bacterium CG_4_10_14_0_2_um_filter_40_20]PJA68862.1 MAG: hypothetical protein CO156_02760 [Candidatus Pacebacteria bacterium CG_4_9_14_3_um_filter_40_12]PJC42173.1 MAG: hypothetical protein CO041_00865 [Candidatus Pacebacteria bacterium CG_4_9_1
MINLPVVGNAVFSVLDIEFADDEKGCKIVFSARNGNGKLATFETGTFFDNNNDEAMSPKHDICVSTAGGCTRRCEFCSVPSAALGFERLLTAEEIAYQIRYSVALRNPDGTLPNVVGMMGNGEPPDNAKNVIAGLMAVINDPTIDIDRVTLSTIGENQKGIFAFTKVFAGLEVPVALQFSLHVADEVKRRLIIPGKRSIAEIMPDVDYYAEVTGIPVKFNVVLMEKDGFTNASIKDAKQLAALLQAPSFYSGRQLAAPRRLKLSAYNPVPKLPFYGPAEETKTLFLETLAHEGVTTIKTFKGSGIEIDPVTGKGGFACGQLRATTFAQLSR